MSRKKTIKEKQIPILYFKGVNTKTSDLLMTDEELKEGVNIDLSNYGIIQKRAGYIQRGDQITPDKDILGLVQYYASDGTSQLIAGCNTSDDTNIQISARTQQNYYWNVYNEAYPNTKFEGANFIDYLYIVGYSVSDDTFLPTLSWDGENTKTKDDDTNLTDCPQGKFIVLVNGYLLILNGKDHNDERATSRVWWANPPTTLPLALTWDNDNNWWDFEPHNGQEITGAISNFNRAIIFKNTSTHVFDPVGQDAKMISSSIGCDTHRSIQNVGNFTIFYNRKGVYATNSQDIQYISAPVEAFIEAINQDNVFDVCAGMKDNKYYHLFIGDVTVDGTDYTNCELVYDVQQNTWKVNELANTITIYCNYVQPVITTTTSTITSSTSSITTSSSSSSSESTSSSSESTSSSSESTSSSTSSESTSSSSVSSSSSSSTSITEA